MRPFTVVLGVAIAVAACSSGLQPPTSAMIASMPDTIPCEKAVKVEAGSERNGIAAERRWLDGYYPNHGAYGQAVARQNGRTFDILTFRRDNGHEASVCFDITSFFGRQ